jgi:uncharacterized repeat protein (TIGR01451 family)
MAAQVAVDVVGPARVTLGHPFIHEIVVCNTGRRAVSEVHVEEPIPPGVQVLRADPPAKALGDSLSWNLETLEAGAERRLKVEVRSAGASELHFRPYAAFQTGAGLHTQMVRPAFEVEMIANRVEVARGGRITFKIRVSNHGDTLIRNVKLYDQLPPGLLHPKGEVVGTDPFDLPRDTSRAIDLEVVAVQAGKLRNEVVAQADGGVEARARVEVTVKEPTLALQVDGPKQGTTRQDLEFHVEVANPGPATATKPTVVQVLPASLEVVSVSSGGGFDPAKHAVVWALGDLAANQRQVLTCKLKASAPGELSLQTMAQADKIVASRATNALRIEGVRALKLELHAAETALAVGAETTIEMHVINQGDAPCAGVRLTASLSSEVTPLASEGPTSGQVQQQEVRYPALGQLPPRADAVYRIRVRGQKVGKGSLKVELNAERELPIQHELSIQVNGQP